MNFKRNYSKLAITNNIEIINNVGVIMNPRHQMTI